MTNAAGTVFFLPGLGFGARSAAPIRAALGERFRVIGIDLPGQGPAPDAPDGSLDAMVDAALTAIKADSNGGPWILAAHSMGGKVAALVAARVLSGQANVFGLQGAVLMAPSPPSPEPMDDDKRELMLSWAERGAVSEAHAREFIAQNVARPLSANAEQDAIEQVRQSSPLAWTRWLTEGSREDVTANVGVLNLPVVVLAGEDDDDLGAAAQPSLLSSTYPRARFVSLAATGHLLPYERATEVAEAITRLWDSTVELSPQVTPEWGRVIASTRTGVHERGSLARRAISDDSEYTPQALTTAQLTTLRALADRLVPQLADRRIDLAARVDSDLASGRGDGWRPAALPIDTSAYRLGLDAVASVWPDGVEEQDALIQRIIANESISGSPWNADVMRGWFEDVRNELTRAWLAHPASLARIGYDGFATSGSTEQSVGYVSLGAGLRDPWEPTELGTRDEGDRRDEGVGA